MMKRAANAGNRSRIAWRISVACALACALGTAIIAVWGQRGAHPAPSPTAANAAQEGIAGSHHAAHQRDGSAQDDGFPVVDWEHWLEVNPDVVGWITVPGTGIDLPIVQAPDDDPCYYLSHDVYGEPNYTGCPYLDAACDGMGGLLACRNSVVFGHNMGWNRDMFADLDRFADPSFAAGHREILVQTPQAKSRLRVQAADVIPGWESAKRTDFDTEADFDAWWTERFEAADVRLADGPPRHRALLTLCTCSYNRWQDERTLVYCMAC